MVGRVDLGEGIGAAFTDREGGASSAPYDSLNLGGAVGDDAEAVRKNRAIVEEALGLAAGRTVWMRQVHGAEVAVATGPLPPPSGETDPPGVDAVLTTEPGLALAVLVADCAPVLLADPVARVVGAAHSGRPGTALGVVPALVTAMCEHGAVPSRLRAMIGPVVCGGCYEVPAGLRDEVSAVVPEARATTREGTPALDIRAGIAAQLRAAGVAAIGGDPRCTMETPALYSYRRDGRTGRFAGYVWLKP
ncbi:peptidoglycan editing factor PgeF [Actinomadura sp. HBU206391]|uniref:peptidoglycan editing factor PgeF n=1 Tax=Actinomadura sp. HBU206391 TaxID=2731692 RepID=UPI00165030C6|nr:peptidoglycan editing factor PgeF [Actinomadura sp. HBU206391]MBC6462889.1 peptidoglycan editing factor PgeF [Actinomadura sp. HBU206391]